MARLRQTNIAGWEMDPLKMGWKWGYVFNCYVSLQEVVQLLTFIGISNFVRNILIPIWNCFCFQFFSKNLSRPTFVRRWSFAELNWEFSSISHSRWLYRRTLHVPRMPGWQVTRLFGASEKQHSRAAIETNIGCWGQKGSRIWSSTLTPAEAIHWGGRRERPHRSWGWEDTWKPQTPSMRRCGKGSFCCRSWNPTNPFEFRRLFQ